MPDHASIIINDYNMPGKQCIINNTYEFMTNTQKIQAYVQGIQNSSQSNN